MIRQTIPCFTSEEAEKVEGHIYRIYDANGDGVIDFHEELFLNYYTTP